MGVCNVGVVGRVHLWGLEDRWLVGGLRYLEEGSDTL